MLMYMMEQAKFWTVKGLFFKELFCIFKCKFQNAFDEPTLCKVQHCLEKGFQIHISQNSHFSLYKVVRECVQSFLLFEDKFPPLIIARRSFCKKNILKNSF